MLRKSKAQNYDYEFHNHNNKIFTFPLNPPLTKGDLWQGVALLAYGDGYINGCCSENLQFNSALCSISTHFGLDFVPR